MKVKDFISSLTIETLLNCSFHVHENQKWYFWAETENLAKDIKNGKFFNKNHEMLNREILSISINANADNGFDDREIEIEIRAKV